MDFLDFLVNWLPMAMIGLFIYLYVQQWLCHPETERGLHWRGTFLKFASWPVFLRGFLLSLRNVDIPYIPTAKQAVKGFTPFVRPLLVHQVVFLLTFVFVFIRRMYFTPETRMAFTSSEVWGMVAFAALAYFMTFGGIFAAWQSRKIGKEEPWTEVDLEKIKTPDPE
jgi:cellulose synthase (UDP-forming)